MTTMVKPCQCPTCNRTPRDTARDAERLAERNWSAYERAAWTRIRDLYVPGGRT